MCKVVERARSKEPANHPPQEHADFNAEHDRVERRNTVLVTVAWLVVLPLLVVAALHVVAHDATPELIALNAFTQWLYAPAWLLMLIGLGLRRRALVLCAGAVVCAHVVWLDPSSSRSSRHSLARFQDYQSASMPPCSTAR